MIHIFGVPKILKMNDITLVDIKVFLGMPLWGAIYTDEIRLSFNIP